MNLYMPYLLLALTRGDKSVIANPIEPRSLCSVQLEMAQPALKNSSDGFGDCCS